MPFPLDQQLQFWGQLGKPALENQAQPQPEWQNVQAPPAPVPPTNVNSLPGAAAMLHAAPAAQNAPGGDPWIIQAPTVPRGPTQFAQTFGPQNPNPTLQQAANGPLLMAPLQRPQPLPRMHAPNLPVPPVPTPPAGISVAARHEVALTVQTIVTTMLKDGIVTFSFACTPDA